MKTLEAKVSRLGSKPVLLISDKPTVPATVYLKDMDFEEIKSLAAAGIRIFTFKNDLGNDPGFKKFRAFADGLQEAAPGCYFFPRVRLEPSKEWLENHPDEVTTDELGRKSGRLSFASDLWLETMVPVFKDFIKLCESEYSESIIGYHLGAGYCNEWFWGAGEYLDYSACSVRAFKKWSRDKYDNKIEELNAAWNTDFKYFDNITLPGIAERAAGDHGFRSDETNCYALDFDRFVQAVTVSRIKHFAAICKENTNGHKLTGVFYGYIDDISGYLEALQMQGCGHGALSDIIDDPNIDFFASPLNYYDRRGRGSDNIHCAVDSVSLHGKLMFTEIDTRTCLAQQEKDFPDLRNTSMEESLEVMKRNFSYVFCKNTAFWWMELRGEGWFDHPVFLDMISRTNKLYEEGYAQKSDSVAEIAVFLDEKTPMHLDPTSHLMHSTVFYQMPQISKIGAPFDFFQLNDFENMPKGYKLYIFLNTLNIDKDLKDKIQSTLKENSATALWTYAPGVINGNKFSLDNIEETCGIKISELDICAGAKIKTVESDHKLLDGIEKDYIYGGEAEQPANKGFLVKYPNLPVRPIFHSADNQAMTLGVSNINNNPALVVKEQDGWNSIYSAVGSVPAKLLANIAEFAGCHLYSRQNDVVYAKESWLAVHFCNDGKKQLHLPDGKQNAVEFFSSKSYENSPVITIEAKAATTCLFELK